MSSVPSPHTLQSDFEGADVFINGVVAQVTEELASLKRLLAPVEERWIGGDLMNLGVKEEWNIATDGLFGPAGVLGYLAGAMNINWPNYGDAAWSEDETRRR
jgi:hypothetical protein